jgi:uncharacterized membrane protein YebE (DUF533 family)
MFDAKELLGAMLQGGLTESSTNRMQHAFGERGIGQSDGFLSQLLGAGQPRTGAGTGDLLASLTNVAQEMFGSAGRSVQSGNPLAVGGLAALAGSLLGGGRSSVKGAVGGGVLALLGSLALNALKNLNTQAAGQEGLSTAQLPVGLRNPATADEEKELESKAALILRAMINVAMADGQISTPEIQRILGKIEEGGVSAEERAFVDNEIRRPLDLDSLIREVSSPQVAAEVYAASLLAIEVDTQAERDYLRRLAQGLGLDDGVVQQLHATLGVN